MKKIIIATTFIIALSLTGCIMVPPDPIPMHGGPCCHMPMGHPHMEHGGFHHGPH